jgi:hypothetical protein
MARGLKNLPAGSVPVCLPTTLVVVSPATASIIQWCGPGFKNIISVRKIVIAVVLVLNASMFAVEPEAKVAFVKNNQIFASSAGEQPKQLTHGAAAK